MRLRETRTRWGGTQAEFAKAIGIHENNVGKYESGQQDPKAWVLYRIAMVTGVSPKYLLMGDEHHGQPTVRDQVQTLLRSLRAEMEQQRLPDAAKARYVDLLRFIGIQMRRLVFDAERLLQELRSHHQQERFDNDEYRRRWIDDADDDRRSEGER